jgi:hypothetical protein
MPIPDFGIGKYDDILLREEAVVSDGQGTGVEDRIANLKKWREDHMTNMDDEIERERRDMQEARRAEREMQSAIAAKNDAEVAV